MPSRTKEQQAELTTKSVIGKTTHTVELICYDPKVRMEFRAFGLHIGDAKTPDGALSVWAFGNTIEVHHSESDKKVEFSIGGLVTVAKKLMEGK